MNYVPPRRSDGTLQKRKTRFLGPPSGPFGLELTWSMAWKKQSRPGAHAVGIEIERAPL